MEPIRENDRQLLKKMIIDKLKEYIINEGLVANDQLPPERKLSEMFGVSRTIIREALSYLENTGVVRVRQGQGTFINQSNIKHVLESFFFLWRINHGDLKEILGLRLIFETSAIDEIISKELKSSISTLKEVIERGSKASTNEEFRNADMEFHKELLKATDNPLFTQLSNMVTNYFFHTQHITLTNTEFKQITEEHLAIVKALEADDAQKAKILLSNHIHNTKV